MVEKGEKPQFGRGNGLRVSTAGKWYSPCGDFLLWRHKRAFWRVQSNPISPRHRANTKLLLKSGVQRTNFPTRQAAFETLQKLLS